MNVLWRGTWVQRARIASGLVLFVFALTHFMNHALGLISVEAMQDMQDLRTVVTRSWPGTVVLATALLVHIALGLARIVSRATFQMPTSEAVQTGLGLLIPFLLLPHIINTRIATSFFGVDDTYAYELARLWPVRGWWQSLLLLAVWAHGCIGLHFWLRLWEPYRQVQMVLLGFAVALPLAALGGFMAGGKEVARTVADPAAFAALKSAVQWPSPAADAALAEYRGWVTWVAWAMLALVAVVAARRFMIYQGQPKVTVAYTGGPTVTMPVGSTLLEISRHNKVPHSSVCGGRGRCSTCRVRIEDGLEHLPVATFAEAATLASIYAPRNVRLACQVRPERKVVVTRLLRPGTTGPSAVNTLEADSDGAERVLALMFLDVRHFTRMTQRKLPYDVVFILNEFFAATGQAIARHGGTIDKFMGDGLLAVFGRRTGPEAGCRQALQAARAIDLALDHVNAKLQSELSQPLEVGMGIHAGPLLLGRIGWGEAVDMTVIGHTVNAASRLEALTKVKGCQLVISREVAQYAGWNVDQLGGGEMIDVRGIERQIEILCINRGRDLPPEILGSGWEN